MSLASSAASTATTSGSQSPAPATSVASTCAAALSPGPIAAARPPCASGVAPPIRSLVTISTRSPRAAALSAAEIPAAPDPTTTTSASRRHRARPGRRLVTVPPVRARWRRDADVVVVGSGAAGISAALSAAARGLRVLMVTKDLIGGATPLAQGGLAAAIGPGDSAAAHVDDTLVAGAGLCEPEVVAALAAGAPGAIDWLTGLGARLETRELRLEGGHSRHRIVHSGDDASGAEVHRVLLAALLASDIEILDRTVAIDLIPRESAPLALKVQPPITGQIFGASESAPGGVGQAGLVAGVIGPDGRLEPGVIDARAVVIAAGGLGQAFATTSNPAGATGDGIALAVRAGAVLRLSLIHISEPTRLGMISYAVFCLKKKKKKKRSQGEGQ